MSVSLACPPLARGGKPRASEAMPEARPTRETEPRRRHRDPYLCLSIAARPKSTGMSNNAATAIASGHSRKSAKILRRWRAKDRWPAGHCVVCGMAPNRAGSWRKLTARLRWQMGVAGHFRDMAGRARIPSRHVMEPHTIVVTSSGLDISSKRACYAFRQSQRPLRSRFGTRGRQARPACGGTKPTGMRPRRPRAGR